jgi:hypothetical protein
LINHAARQRLHTTRFGTQRRRDLSETLAHSVLDTATFVSVYKRMPANDHHGAGHLWSELETTVPLLFHGANPMPIKYCL